jgi:hypothetical protein
LALSLGDASTSVSHLHCPPQVFIAAYPIPSLHRRVSHPKSPSPRIHPKSPSPVSNQVSGASLYFASPFQVSENSTPRFGAPVSGYQPVPPQQSLTHLLPLRPSV